MADNFNDGPLLMKIKQVQAESGKNRIDLEIEKEVIYDRFDELQEQIYKIDKKIIKSSQYTRRQNLIIDGIPDNIPQDKLQSHCIQIVCKLDFHSLHPPTRHFP